MLQPILIEGAPGTGKESLARGIHAESKRSAEPFVAFDPARIPAEHLEITLFGRDSAGGESPGLFEAAKAGTLYLKEVSRLPLPLQTKLIRVLERRQYSRVGSEKLKDAPFRWIASSTKDLRTEIDAARFMDGLYDHIAARRITIPSLDKRREDIVPIANAILSESNPSSPVQLEGDASAYLASQDWTGNVSDLREVLLRAAAASTGTILREHLSTDRTPIRDSLGQRLEVDLRALFVDAKDSALMQFEAAYLSTLMRRCKGNVSLAARESGLARHYLRDLLRKHNLYGIHWVQDSMPPPKPEP